MNKMNRIVISALTVLSLAMFGLIGLEIWNRAKPKTPTATVAPQPASAPEAQKPRPAEKQEKASSWERHAG